MRGHAHAPVAAGFTVETRGIGAIGSRREATRWCPQQKRPRPARRCAEGPRFGLATATFVVVSSMIGTGVLTTSGFTVYFVGSNQLMLALWVVGGVLAVCGALTLCELSAALPRSGGDYVFLSEAYGPLAAFLSGWVSFLIGFGGPIAASASAAAKYLLAPLRLGDASAAIAQPAVASVAIVALGVVHCLGRGSTIRAQAGMTALKIGILVDAGGRRPGGRLGSVGEPRRPTADVLEPARHHGLVAGLHLVRLHRLERGVVPGRRGRPPAGADAPRDPAGHGPGAGPLPGPEHWPTPWPCRPPTSGRSSARPENVNAIAPIAQIAVDRLYGHRVADPLSVAIGLTLLASVSAYILTGPRVAYAMARAGQFPEVAGRLSARGAPAIATALQVAWSLVLLWTASFERILLYSGVGLAIFSMLTVSAVYVLRRRQPDLSASVSDARLSDRAGHLPRRDRPADRGRLLRAASRLVDLPAEHRRRRARLLSPRPRRA